ncbi:hypothetical protein LX36DRAFT_279717 [Colletotrichum falcatum]|nr:hypothetical protein LX36DRAFT_279717 [Colletotrichum falcatum]
MAPTNTCTLGTVPRCTASLANRHLSHRNLGVPFEKKKTANVSVDDGSVQRRGRKEPPKTRAEPWGCLIADHVASVSELTGGEMSACQDYILHTATTRQRHGTTQHDTVILRTLVQVPARAASGDAHASYPSHPHLRILVPYSRTLGCMSRRKDGLLQLFLGERGEGVVRLRSRGLGLLGRHARMHAMGKLRPIFRRDNGLQGRSKGTNTFPANG